MFTLFTLMLHKVTLVYGSIYIQENSFYKIEIQVSKKVKNTLVTM